MALFTGKGDSGTTKTYGCDQRVSKSSQVTEALGSLDEINSFLGICKVASKEIGYKLGDESFAEIIDTVQQTLFSIQAQVAGFPMNIPEEKALWAGELVNLAEKEMPPIKTFFVSGGTALAAKFDFARTIARRAERRVVGVSEEGKVKVEKGTLSFLNRLSSLLYALARLSNHKSGIKEEPPKYK